MFSFIFFGALAVLSALAKGICRGFCVRAVFGTAVQMMELEFGVLSGVHEFISIFFFFFAEFREIKTERCGENGWRMSE